MALESVSPPLPRPSVTQNHKKSMSWITTKTAKRPNSTRSGSLRVTSARISAPRFSEKYEIMHTPRSGTLGSGATIVRTPQDALSESAPLGETLLDAPQPSPIDDDSGFDLDAYSTDLQQPSPPESPPARSLPEVQVLSMPAPPQAPHSPARPSVLRRPSLKAMTEVHNFPPVPALPSGIAIPPQPDFEPILMSSPISDHVDFNKIIVSLETTTRTFRVAFSTLTSKPSHLATYLSSLIPKSPRNSDAHSVDEDQEEDGFHSIFQNHLKATGVLRASSVEIFLDRPSTPYEHILAYLRAPSTAEYPAALPRAVQLKPSTTPRLEALLELRDEAKFLDLPDLLKLCNEELRYRQSDDPPARMRYGSDAMHARAPSTSSSGASMHSTITTTLRERIEHASVRESISDFSSNEPSSLSRTPSALSTLSLHSNGNHKNSPSISYASPLSGTSLDTAPLSVTPRSPLPPPSSQQYRQGSPSTSAQVPMSAPVESLKPALRPPPPPALHRRGSPSQSSQVLMSAPFDSHSEIRSAPGESHRRGSPSQSFTAPIEGPARRSPPPAAPHHRHGSPSQSYPALMSAPVDSVPTTMGSPPPRSRSQTGRRESNFASMRAAPPPGWL